MAAHFGSVQEAASRRYNIHYIARLLSPTCNRHLGCSSCLAAVAGSSPILRPTFSVRYSRSRPNHSFLVLPLSSYLKLPRDVPRSQRPGQRTPGFLLHSWISCGHMDIRLVQRTPFPRQGHFNSRILLPHTCGKPRTFALGLWSSCRCHPLDMALDGHVHKGFPGRPSCHWRQAVHH